jgi:hypothetical protein
VHERSKARLICASSETFIRRSPYAPFRMVQMPFNPAQCPLRSFPLVFETSKLILTPMGETSHEA